MGSTNQLVATMMGRIHRAYGEMPSHDAITRTKEPDHQEGKDAAHSESRDLMGSRVAERNESVPETDEPLDKADEKEPTDDHDPDQPEGCVLRIPPRRTIRRSSGRRIGSLILRTNLGHTPNGPMC